MEIAEPSIRTACLSCINQGATKIVCHPYFLGIGKHVQEDIPKIVADARLEFTNIDIVLTPPLGMNPRIIDLIHDSLQDTLPS